MSRATKSQTKFEHPLFQEGIAYERERIIKLLEEERSEWLSHDGECDCRIKGLEVERLIALINGENK